MDRFVNMKTFIQIVDSGSMSAAAENLNVAKSAISRRLKELEVHLGVELFHRTTRSMSLTDSGTHFYQQAVRIIDDTLEAENSISNAHETLKGSLKIAMPYSFGKMHLYSAINDFLKEHPDIEFDLDFNERKIDIVQEGFDVAIRIANLPDSSLIARRITTVKHAICASPSYLEKHGYPTSLEDLFNHKCLTFKVLQNYKIWKLIDQNNQPIEVPIKPIFKSSAGESLRDAALEGHGICYIPTFLTYKEIERKKLIILLNDYKSPELNVYAVYPQTRHVSKRVRVFVDFLAKRFAGTPYWDNCLSM